MEQLVRKNILALEPYSSARDENTSSEGVFLDANENPYGIYNRYPDPYQRQLKQQLSKVKNIPVENIFVGNGSDEVIDLVFRIFCEPGKDKALIFTPTYGMYEVAANINNVELIKIPLNGDFQLDMDALQPHLSDKNLKLIILCTPNNPTANLMKDEDIRFILNKFRGILVLDEAYIDFTSSPSYIKKISEYPRLIVSQTLSKAWGVAGLRVGLAFMNEKVLGFFNKVKPPYNVSLINQQTALEVLQDKERFEANLKAILAEKVKVVEQLSNLPLVKHVYPSDTNFVLVKVDNANYVYNYLVERKIIVRNRHSVVNNSIRITIGTPSENEALINALKEIK